jgi:hypothetical protein
VPYRNSPVFVVLTLLLVFLGRRICLERKKSFVGTHRDPNSTLKWVEALLPTEDFKSSKKRESLSGWRKCSPSVFHSKTREGGVEVKQVILMAPLFSFPLLPAERAFIAATLPSLSPCGLLKSSIVFCLFLKTHCPVFDPLLPPVVLGSRPHSRSGQDYERLKMQCMKAMADLQSLQNQHSSTLKRCEEAVKKADFYQ